MIWPFRRKQKATETKQQTVSDSKRNQSGFFSTHNREFRRSDLSGWIAKNMFQKTHTDYPAVMHDGSAVAMDGMDGYNAIKQGFQMNNGAISQNLFAWFVSQSFIGYQACAIVAQQWLVNKACTVAPQDAVRKGYEIVECSGKEIPLEALDRLRQLDKDFGINKTLVEFAKFNRVFGIRIALFHVESSDPDYYQKPFNIDGVTAGSYKGISQVDPMWCTPELDADASANTASKYFYEPTWWRINGVRYHRTHLVVIRFSEVPDLMKPTYIYGGLPLTQMIMERVYAAERTANEAPLLALTKRTTVLHTDMDVVMADQAAFEEKMMVWMQYRDNQGIKVVGEDEQVDQIDTTLSDIDALIMTQYQLVSAIAQTPATKLLGTSVKGFNATGEYDESVYHEYLETIQNDELTPLVNRHHQLCIRSDEELVKHGVFDVEIQWKPLDSMTEEEAANVQFTKSQAAMNYQMTGAVDGLDIRRSLISDKSSGYNGLEMPDDYDAPIDDDFTSEITEAAPASEMAPNPKEAESINAIGQVKTVA